jgi:hypothetical protein
MALCLSWSRDAAKRELAKRASSRITEAKRIGKDLLTKARREGIKLVDLSPDDLDVRKRAKDIVTRAKLEARRLLREAKEPVKEPVKTEKSSNTNTEKSTKAKNEDAGDIKLF